ncbi:hypothetical protein chiPu_0007281 [Chiloscyllium punctatum]|uniref:Uncharacterized protein n=1 Tax=Chiloscyllium punctatum TaxID=137246 RepID=A0A401SEK5_CHIPU|nr:hypothetical protein [Chiloscyllium punctatum]
MENTSKCDLYEQSIQLKKRLYRKIPTGAAPPEQDGGGGDSAAPSADWTSPIVTSRAISGGVTGSLITRAAARGSSRPSNRASASRRDPEPQIVGEDVAASPLLSVTLLRVACSRFHFDGGGDVARTRTAVELLIFDSNLSPEVLPRKAENDQCTAIPES